MSDKSDQQKFQTVGYTGGSDEHDTPVSFFAPIAEAVDGFDLDPSASETSDLADRNVTKSEDGLSIPWEGDVWLNPPYSEVGEWLEYAKQQYKHGNADRVVALVFARTSTRWWHNHATTADVRCFVKGRLKFGGAENSAPAPSAVLVWGDAPDALVSYLERKGDVISAPDRRTVLDELGELFDAGLSGPKALDYYATETADGYQTFGGFTQTEWSDVRGRSQQAISESVREGREILESGE
jgi:phage N-6-adenine-methyltransferase